MRDKIEKLLLDVENFTVQSKEQVEEYRIKWLSKKGEITTLFDDFKTVAPEMKREMGQKLNELKTKAQDKINELKEKFEASSSSTDANIDYT
ncbi:MAG: phenylalanine--tRNA ligase subunit alpha, partial [Bacteroidia bacterium]